MFDAFQCHLFGHLHEITDMFVCLSYSTMVTASQDGLIIIWDINKLTFVNSIQLQQPIYKVCISETTNDIALIVNNPNKLLFYTGNCEFINETDASEAAEANLTIKSLCFSNCTEGNINVLINKIIIFKYLIDMLLKV